MVKSILASLYSVALRCDGPADAWARRNLERAIVLVGGMDEEEVAEILEDEGI